MVYQNTVVEGQSLWTEAFSQEVLNSEVEDRPAFFISTDHSQEVQLDYIFEVINRHLMDFSFVTPILKVKKNLLRNQ